MDNRYSPCGCSLCKQYIEEQIKGNVVKSDSKVTLGRSTPSICELKKKGIADVYDVLKKLECGIQPDLEWILETISQIEILLDEGFYYFEVPEMQYDSNTPINMKDLQERLNALESQLREKQDLLVSGQNIKTINDETLLGEGNITIEGGSDGGGSQDDEESSGGGGDIPVIKPIKLYYGGSNDRELDVETEYTSFGHTTNSSVSNRTLLKYYYVLVRGNSNIRVVTNNNEPITDWFINDGTMTIDNTSYKIFKFHLDTDLTYNLTINITIT